MRLPRTALPSFLGLLIGCASATSATSSNTEAWAPGPPANERAAAERSPEPPPPEVVLFEDGERTRVHEAPADAIALDLSEDWVPLPLRGSADGDAPAYRAQYLASAADPAENLAVYGVVPALSVARQRLAETARHECHDAVEDEALATIEGTLLGWRRHRARQRQRRDRVDRLRSRVEAIEERRAEDDLDEGEAEALEEELASLRERLADQAPEVRALRAAQAHLRCDGLLAEDAEDAVIDRATREALAAYQARHSLLPTQRLDPDTRRTLRIESRELDFLVLLRVLRERVADATGLLADGSAAGESAQVFGHYLDPQALRTRPNDETPPNAAPDRLSPATEAAAEALGWTDPAAALEALEALHADPVSGPVAVRVPDLPSAPNAILGVRVEIDRGDVYYDFPYTRNGRRRHQPMDELPALTVYVTRDGAEEAVVRWPTTIGMWAEEQTATRRGLRYEESPVGERVWRDMVVAPRWLPPRGIPDDALLTREEGRWQADYETVGPGPSSAYGLVMLVHHDVRPPDEPEGDPRYVDEGIRSHGTGNLRSIVEDRQGSHGCHRLFNTNVMRLSSFLLRHREHVHHGPVDVSYRRRLRHRGRSGRLEIDSRGYRIELDPPVAIEVLEGEIRGHRDTPIDGLRPLPRQLRARAAEDDDD